MSKDPKSSTECNELITAAKRIHEILDWDSSNIIIGGLERVKARLFTPQPCNSTGYIHSESHLRTASAPEGTDEVQLIGSSDSKRSYYITRGTCYFQGKVYHRVADDAFAPCPGCTQRREEAGV
jgi:hypothetical protein